MKEIILIKNGEIALKGLNRATFEDIMIKNMRRRLSRLGKFKITRAQSTVVVEPENEEIDLDEAVEILKKVFGIAAMSRARVTEKKLETIQRDAAEYLKEPLSNVRTFKVEAKRSDKTFPYKSPEICREVGGYLLSQNPHLKVDVHHPDVVVTVEVRDFATYVHAGVIHGAGGIPIGSSGKAMLLISGGIDSPVAGYMMAKRGLILDAIHFVSPPYTSERAKLKVLELARKMGEYCGTIKMHIVPFTHIQEQIREQCPEDLFTIIMRRFMMRISEKVAKSYGCEALITGESMGQVASQTLKAIACTDHVCSMPVFRPLIGMDKNEIIEISRKIDTFETSILPYEDCCTVFTPRHPRTKPTISMVEDAEMVMDIEALIEEAISGIEVEIIHM